jgi:hypothetical protein
MEGCLFDHVEISQTTAPLSALLVPLKSPLWVGLHEALMIFRPKVQELLNIEQFCQRKFNKIKTKVLKGNWGKFLVLLKSLSWVNFLVYWISNILYLKFNLISNSFGLSYYGHVHQWSNYIIMFTFGPRTHATLVIHNDDKFYIEIFPQELYIV